jgi:hypothetical protein
MARRPQRSLRHEYELYIEEEIENYKESVPRSALLSIGDEAARNLATDPQTALTELLLWEEVDRIITLRLRLPSYSTWRRRRLKLLTEIRRPEHWGMQPDDALVRAASANPGHALVADAELSALYLAANGCAVTAIAADEDVVRRVVAAAAQLGLSERLHGEIADLGTWMPDAPLHAVVCASRLLADLPARDRAAAIERLQGATAAGGVHILRDVGSDDGPLSVEELRKRYRGWDVSIDRASGVADTFLARKLAS